MEVVLLVALSCVFTTILVLALYERYTFSNKKKARLLADSMTTIDQADYLASISGKYRNRSYFIRVALDKLVSKSRDDGFLRAIEELANDRFITEDHLVSICQTHDLTYIKHDEPDGKPPTFHLSKNSKFDFEDKEREE